MLRNTILFPFTNSSPRVCSHSQSRCHFWKCRIAKHTHKISVLQEYGCTFFLFAGRKHVCLEYQLSFQFSIFLGEQNLHGTAVEQSKMVSQKDSQHLGTSCWHDFVNFPLTLWILNGTGIILEYSYFHMCLCVSTFLILSAGLWSHEDLSQWW